MKISRRKMLQQTAAAAAALPLVRALPPLAPVPPKFFTPAEFALVDELSDMIIPTDAQSGGARAAGVATFIDGQLAESFEREPQTEWRTGLKAVEELSRELNGKAFMSSTPEQRRAVLTRMAVAESDPKTPPEKFFGRIKGATIRAYYSSKIGIHDDQQYKGNVYQTGEYAGYDAT